MLRTVIVFSGRVQGVGFRATARDVASRFPVTGWVRNEPDGSVRMEVQGSETDVRACITALQARMAGFIRSSTASSAPQEPDESSFEVRR